MSVKPAIPNPPPDALRAPFDRAMKECVETIMGRRQGRIDPLPEDANTGQIIAKINEIIARLQ